MKCETDINKTNLSIKTVFENISFSLYCLVILVHLYSSIMLLFMIHISAHIFVPSWALSRTLKWWKFPVCVFVLRGLLILLTHTTVRCMELFVDRREKVITCFEVKYCTSRVLKPPNKENPYFLYRCLLYSDDGYFVTPHFQDDHLVTATRYHSGCPGTKKHYSLLLYNFPKAAKNLEGYGAWWSYTIYILKGTVEGFKMTDST